MCLGQNEGDNQGEGAIFYKKLSHEQIEKLNGMKKGCETSNFEDHDKFYEPHLPKAIDTICVPTVACV